MVGRSFPISCISVNNHSLCENKLKGHLKMVWLHLKTGGGDISLESCLNHHVCISLHVHCFLWWWGHRCNRHLAALHHTFLHFEAVVYLVQMAKLHSGYSVLNCLIPLTRFHLQFFIHQVASLLISALSMSV